MKQLPTKVLAGNPNLQEISQETADFLPKSAGKSTENKQISSSVLARWRTPPAFWHVVVAVKREK
jgi:hypothetical protein